MALKAKLYTTPMCGYCTAAKRLLTEKNIEIEEFDVGRDRELRQKISDQVGGWATVPMIFIDETFIGGFTELVGFAKKGGLDSD